MLPLRATKAARRLVLHSGHSPDFDTAINFAQSAADVESPLWRFLGKSKVPLVSTD